MWTIARLRREWSSLAGRHVSAVSWPLAIDEAACLVVGMASPTFTAELELRAPAIVASLPAIDCVTVRSIRWTYAAPAHPRRERPARGAPWR